jgi:DNA-binding transcriptional ArsR family regulator
MSLLPSRGPDTSTSQDGELQIVGVDEDVSAVLDALSSETAREILNAVYDDPGTPSELADRLGMSIQKVSYHLEKLQEQDLITVAGTQYSEKGQEMNVYEPPDDPLVLFVGTQERKRSLRSLVERLLPVVGVLTGASAAVQVLFGTLPNLFGVGEPGGETQPQSGGDGATETPTPEPTDDGGIGIMETTETPTEEPTPVQDMATEATEAVTSTAASGGLDLEPGVAFFLGGLLVVAVVTAMWLYAE